MTIRRRDFLMGTAIGLALSVASVQARTILGGLPWYPNAGSPPTPTGPGIWQFFTPEEGAAVEALVDRLIPPDTATPGGKDAGCAVFIDRQLAGPYGSARGLYMRPPFRDGSAQQGPQSPLTPAARYRQGLAALDKYCRQTFVGKPFAQLTDEQKDEILTGLERGPLVLDGASARGLFEQLLTNTREGFFADPIYGGNRGMVGWKMIGFPGARYDYRDWVERHNEPFTLPPVSIGPAPSEQPDNPS
jgi:gluconate 2-dehydrogenase gamma chain